MRFFDIGALVHYARIIEWEFPGFSVDGCYGKLKELQGELSREGCISTIGHRFYVVAEKPL